MSEVEMDLVRSDLPPSTWDLQALRDAFGEKLQVNVPLARFTSARAGGPADALLVVESAAELAAVVRRLWGLGLPDEERGKLVFLGGGSNVLCSDAGVRGVVVLNRARAVRFDEQADPPTVWCESGTNLGLVARQAAARGLSGLEWAAGIPGTVGGAVFGNAGAYGGDIAGNLRVAEILHQEELDEPGTFHQEEWSAERLSFEYRSSLLKRYPGKAVILSAVLRLAHSTPEAVQARLAGLAEHRHRTQPPGASMGSMFKNPPGDWAGRLIEAAGLKGTRIGDAQISDLHGNFFINHGSASAADVRALIELARQTVAQKSGIHLDLEIELIGEW